MDVVYVLACAVDTNSGRNAVPHKFVDVRYYPVVGAFSIAGRSYSVVGCLIAVEGYLRTVEIVVFQFFDSPGCQKRAVVVIFT